MLGKCDRGIRKTGEVIRVGDVLEPGLGGVEKLFLELAGQPGQLVTDLFETRLRLFG
jgi:hypothetical protein